MSDFINENWLPLSEYEGIYEISSFGRIRSFYHKSPRILKPWKSKKGYFFIRIGKKNRAVHQLVAETFIGKRPQGLVTRHLDGNSFNNSVENLAYGTQSDNERDSVRHGTHYRNCKITPEIAKKIAQDTRRYKEIAQDYGLNHRYVADIKAGLYWGRETDGLRVRIKRPPVNKYLPTEEQRQFICDKNNSIADIMLKLGISRDTIKRIRRENRVGR